MIHKRTNLRLNSFHLNQLKKEYESFDGTDTNGLWLKVMKFIEQNKHLDEVFLSQINNSLKQYEIQELKEMLAVD